MIIPFWLKIVGPLVLLAMVVGSVFAWGNSKYRAGKREGIEQTDAKWEEAGRRLQAEAAKSATRADDRAAERLKQHEQQVEDDRKAVEDATANNSSAIDAIFGG